MHGTTLGKRLRTLRRSRKHSRQKAGEISGVPAPTIRRFETSGEISLRQFLMLTSAYGDLAASESLLPEPGPATMDDLLDLARTASIPRATALRAVEEVCDAASLWGREARHYPIPNEQADEIRKHMDRQGTLLLPARAFAHSRRPESFQGAGMARRCGVARGDIAPHPLT